jgi:hypothetical protein
MSLLGLIILFTIFGWYIVFLWAAVHTRLRNNQFYIHSSSLLVRSRQLQQKGVL